MGKVGRETAQLEVLAPITNFTIYVNPSNFWPQLHINRLSET